MHTNSIYVGGNFYKAMYMVFRSLIKWDNYASFDEKFLTPALEMDIISNRYIENRGNAKKFYANRGL